MEKVEEKDESGRSIGEWHLFDPHEVKQIMGFSLEDYYDEEDGNGSFREKYQQCINNPDLPRETVKAVSIMARIMRSQLETGTPYMFYRDEVNRKNPNKHEGMIYASNLCSEIAQNMSPSVKVSTTITEISNVSKASNLKLEDFEEDQEVIVDIRTPGDMVVCNLSSINLGKAVPADVLERLIPIQVRMLDNVIDINNLPLAQATRNNMRYRAIGLGTFGWHHLLALKQIQWESEEAVEFADKLYEKIAYHTIKASMELAKEKGAYQLFEGSDWQTGKYFVDREYFETVDGLETVKEGSMTDKWKKLYAEIKEHGMRNGYLMAVAPNSSTSIIGGSTASIDPVFNRFFYEEKKNYRLPNAAPDLNPDTYNYYERAHVIDQRWSVLQNAKRQRHIDQAISFNLYVPNTIQAKVLLELHVLAWKNKLKTTYYVRSTATDIKECEWCHS